MAFETQVLRVLIASPSDLFEERQTATDAINEWSAQHAQAESIVLLPIRWETHAKPESGVRPQDALNRQLVKSSDILVGMFWTKIGTPTGVAESGTFEEINEFVAAGKPAQLGEQRKAKLRYARTWRYASRVSARYCLVGALSVRVRYAVLVQRLSRPTTPDYSPSPSPLRHKPRRRAAGISPTSAPCPAPCR
jgi:hypothetical protein